MMTTKMMPTMVMMTITRDNDYLITAVLNDLLNFFL